MERNRSRKKPDDGRVVFDGALTIQSAAAIHATLLAAADQPVVEIDCGEATEIDLSFIQLILSAHAGAQAAGRTFRLTEPAGGALRDALLRGGFLNAANLSGTGGQPTAGQALWLNTGEA